MPIPTHHPHRSLPGALVLALGFAFLAPAFAQDPDARLPLRDEAVKQEGNRYLAAEMFPHNRGSTVTYEDTEGTGSFQRRLLRRDFHHNGIRLLIDRTRSDGEADLETYQIGGAIGVRLDGLRIGAFQMTLEPAVQVMSVYPQLGETFTTTPAAQNPATGNPLTWTCRTVGLELVELADGHTVTCVVVEVKIRDAELGTRLSDYKVWYGTKMGIVQRVGSIFGRVVNEIATGAPELPPR